jgi:hypothetical protein
MAIEPELAKGISIANNALPVKRAPLKPEHKAVRKWKIRSCLFFIPVNLLFTYLFFKNTPYPHGRMTILL